MKLTAPAIVAAALTITITWLLIGAAETLRGVL